MISNDNNMKTEFVNFCKKQFEADHIENIVQSDTWLVFR